MPVEDRSLYGIQMLLRMIRSRVKPVRKRRLSDPKELIQGKKLPAVLPQIQNRLSREVIADLLDPIEKLRIRSLNEKLPDPIFVISLKEATPDSFGQERRNDSPKFSGLQNFRNKALRI